MLSAFVKNMAMMQQLRSTAFGSEPQSIFDAIDDPIGNPKAYSSYNSSFFGPIGNPKPHSSQAFLGYETSDTFLKGFFYSGLTGYTSAGKRIHND